MGGTFEQRARAFLRGLTELTRKYEIEVGSCGCCSSPWLNDQDNSQPGGVHQADCMYSTDSTGDNLRWAHRERAQELVPEEDDGLQAQGVGEPAGTNS